MDQSKVKRQEVKMLNRKYLEITGVVGVDRFHPEAFHLDTECGHMLIKGQNLHIKTLNLEQYFIIIEGVVDEITYHEQHSPRRIKKMMHKWLK